MRKVRRRKLLAALAAVLVLGVVTVATPAGATINWTSIWNTDRGNGVTFTNKSDTGDYQVRFNKNVRNCVYIATLGLPGSLGVELPGQIGVVGENASVNGVWIDTYDSAGTEADRSFHLLVDCDTTSSPALVAPRSGGSGDGATAGGDNG